METSHPLMELWTPDSWLEKMEELHQKPFEELTLLDKYMMCGILAWMMGAPYIVGGGAYYVFLEYKQRKAAKQIGMNK